MSGCCVHLREKKLREEAERERAELQQRLIICQQEARVAHEALRRFVIDVETLHSVWFRLAVYLFDLCHN